MLRDVYLYGALAEKYGKVHRFDCESAPEAVRAFQANYKTFNADIRDGTYEVVIGEYENGTRITEETVGMRMGLAKELHIVPYVQGSKKGGIVQIVIGVVLIVAGAYFHQPWMVGMGISMVIGGVATALTPVPKVGSFAYESREAPEARSSFLFNGPTNRNTEGAVIPLVYGTMRVGSIVVSAGIEVAQI